METNEKKISYDLHIFIRNHLCNLICNLVPGTYFALRNSLISIIAHAYYFIFAVLIKRSKNAHYS